MRLAGRLKQFLRLGQRGAYGQTLLNMGKDCEDLFCLSADLGNSSGLDRFKSKFPERYLNVGISEQHLIGFSSGLSTLGFNCFVSSFAPFITMRCCEQIRMNLGYMQENVKIVSLGSGISMGYLGNSHFGLEDLSIMRSQSKIPIFCPSDTTQLYFILEFMSSYSGPAYLRLTGTADSSKSIFAFDHYESTEKICIGGSSTLQNGSRILVMSHGDVTNECVGAIRQLDEDARVYCHHENIYCLSPLGDRVQRLINEFDVILVVEEHRKTGGLYTQVCELASSKDRSTTIDACCLPDTFLGSGDYTTLKARYGLNAESIAFRLKRMIESL